MGCVLKGHQPLAAPASSGARSHHFCLPDLPVVTSSPPLPSSPTAPTLPRLPSPCPRPQLESPPLRHCFLLSASGRTLPSHPVSPLVLYLTGRCDIHLVENKTGASYPRPPFPQRRSPSAPTRPCRKLLCVFKERCLCLFLPSCVHKCWCASQVHALPHAFFFSLCNSAARCRVAQGALC